MREEQRQKAAAAVTPVLEKVEQEVSEGHGKASAGAAAALRNAFKEHGRHLDSALEARVHAALGAPFVLTTVLATLAGFNHNLVRASLSLGRERGTRRRTRR